MALTPFRWIALAAIGCMLAVLTLVSSAEQDQNRFAGYVRRPAADTAEARLGEIAAGWNTVSQNLAARYRLMQLFDSARRVAARLPDTGSLRVFVSSEYDAKTQAAISNAIRSGRAQRSGNVVGIDLFVLSDTLHFVRGVLRYGFAPAVHYELPQRPGDRCRVYVHSSFSRTQVAWAMGQEQSGEQLFGPCGFYSAFGEPGPLVRQWFMNGGWQYSVVGSWTAAPQPLRYGDDLNIYKSASPALSQLNPKAKGPACMKGDLATCERIAATFPLIRGRMPVANPEIGQSLGYSRPTSAGLGGRAAEMLSAAVQRLGRERFRQFWTSRDSVPVAFEKASGERWGAFIQGWMIARYGAIDAGPKMSPFALLMSVVIVLTAMAATLRMSLTRTYV